MKVTITNGRQGFWYENLVGNQFEVTSAGHETIRGMEGLMNEMPRDVVVVAKGQEFEGNGI